MTRRLIVAGLAALGLSVLHAPLDAQPSAVTLRAPRLIDGRGQQRTDAVVTVGGGRITAVGAAQGPATYDLTGLTLLPGFIDTHVHIGWHFANGRFVSGRSPRGGRPVCGRERLGHPDGRLHHHPVGRLGI
ncbi:MAG: hypothetical protein R2745_21825 [Vicinamibacterales bacterium]